MPYVAAAARRLEQGQPLATKGNAAGPERSSEGPSGVRGIASQEWVLNTLLTGLTLLLTVLVALALGIYLGYGLITGLLNVLGNRHETEPASAVLITSEAHGGD